MIHSQRENARYLKAFDNNWDVEIKKKIKGAIESMNKHHSKKIQT